jgi:hypothetical protein
MGFEFPLHYPNEMTAQIFELPHKGEIAPKNQISGIAFLRSVAALHYQNANN